MLQKLVLDVETGLRGYRDHRSNELPDAVPEPREPSCPAISSRLEQLVADEPAQRRRARGLIADDPRLPHGVRGAGPALLERGEPRRRASWRPSTEGKRRIDEIRRQFDELPRRGGRPGRVPCALRRRLVEARDRAGSQRSRRFGRVHPPLRPLPRPLDRTTGPRSSLGRCTARGRRPLACASGGRPGRGRRADAGLQRDGRALEDRSWRSEEAEREAARERPHEVGAREHRVARAEDAARGSPRVHVVAALEGLRRRDAPALPRRRRRPGAKALGVDRQVPGRAPHRGGRFAHVEEVVDIAPLLREEAQLYEEQSGDHRVEIDVPEEPLAGARRSQTGSGR